ncbi:LytTR family DNA-binding domain-containing protein [Marivirga harenae]|uniref:LytR/AlgR family response regulator transcription factor n=1 Tax=Marivirga harenae TaxID=2010992 RepID=UPI0026DF9A6A|nr:LytTR family DNA-binding domain-containing protein [Marivirga harenae]WKV11233.1 LytTR family DNA-binding domain-containing protein [Marivirga harenae]|tara:strand:+ start:115654 stop:116505 length:852 start_codon:yes stop_codon:yes gene_type:complete
MFSIFQKPHPFIFNSASIVIPGIFTFLLIFIFKPLGFNSLPINYVLAFALGFGLIASSLVLISVKLLKFTFPKWMDEDAWTLGKEVFLIFTVLILIAFTIFIIFLGIDIADSSPFALFRMVFIKTLLFSAFPILFMVLFEQYNYQRTQLKEAVDLSQKVTHEKNSHAFTHSIRAENGQLVLQLASKEILWAQSDGNYLDLYYINEANEIKKELIRNRLKNLADQLPDDSFFHCHKSYLINLNHIQKVQGNARNFEVILRYANVSIPVARSKSAELKEKINHNF